MMRNIYLESDYESSTSQAPGGLSLTMCQARVVLILQSIICSLRDCQLSNKRGFLQVLRLTVVVLQYRI